MVDLFTYIKRDFDAKCGFVWDTSSFQVEFESESIIQSILKLEKYNAKQFIVIFICFSLSGQWDKPVAGSGVTTHHLKKMLYYDDYLLSGSCLLQFTFLMSGSPFCLCQVGSDNMQKNPKHINPPSKTTASY